MAAAIAGVSNKMFVVAGNVYTLGIVRAAKTNNHAILMGEIKRGLLRDSFKHGFIGALLAGDGAGFNMAERAINKQSTKQIIFGGDVIAVMCGPRKFELVFDLIFLQARG